MAGVPVLKEIITTGGDPEVTAAAIANLAVLEPDAAADFAQKWLRDYDETTATDIAKSGLQVMIS
ncbi:hypothetical protein, partial [Mycobacterium tuberculosis]|uniref:hypothetical protein n=1 Tax=Mycobacterium tuberculosis TaxID=1773 RepID=UPI00254DF629